MKKNQHNIFNQLVLQVEDIHFDQVEHYLVLAQTQAIIADAALGDSVLFLTLIYWPYWVGNKKI